MKNVETVLITAPRLDTSFLVHGVSSVFGDYVTYMLVDKPLGRTVAFVKDKLIQDRSNNLVYKGDSVISNGSWIAKEHDGVIL